MRILNAEQMREAERITIEEIGLASLVLMENAGRQVVSAIDSVYAEEIEGHVAVLCGRGNNGGDGFVVARVLLERGADVTVFLFAAVADVRGDARVNLDVLGRIGSTVVEITDEQSWELHSSEVAQSTLIVDALFGTGLRSPLGGMLETVVADVNALGTPIVAIDLPSGLSADVPLKIGPCIDASLTVTLSAPKLPLVLPPTEPWAGDVVIAQIGIPTDVIEELEGPRIDLLTPEALRHSIEPRTVDAHKGDFGRVTVIAGSRGKTGAAYLSAAAALRSGAGLVTIAMPGSCLPILASMGAEYMTEPLAEEADGTLAAAALETVLQGRHDVIACGPGLGRTPGVAAFVRGLLARASVPLVLDADALTAIADDLSELHGREDREVIVTPHPGEMARLLGATTDAVQLNRLEYARDFATSRHLYVVLKGHRTLIATPEGRVFVNPTGGPGLATGGTGDVLTGVIAAWLAQLLDAEAACRLGVFLHGAAGDLAEAEEGQVGMIASSVVAALGPAIRRLVEPSAGSAASATS